MTTTQTNGARSGPLLLVNGETITKAELLERLYVPPGSPPVTDGDLRARLERLREKATALRERDSRERSELAWSPSTARLELARVHRESIDRAGRPRPGKRQLVHEVRALLGWSKYLQRRTWLERRALDALEGPTPFWRFFARHELPAPAWLAGVLEAYEVSP